MVVLFCSAWSIYIISRFYIGIWNNVCGSEYAIIKKSDITYVILERYNDKFIIAPIDLASNTLYKKFQLIDLESQENVGTIIETANVKGKLNIIP
jgi:hypothetical protein